MTDVTFVLPSYEPYSPKSGLALAIVVSEVVAELTGLGVTARVIAPDDGTATYEQGDRTLISPKHATQAWRWVTRHIGIYQRSVDPYAAAVAQVVRDQPNWDGPVIVLNDAALAAAIAAQATTYLYLQNLLSPSHELHLRDLRGALAVSGFVAQDLRSRLPALPIVVVPNGVNIETFRPLAHSPDGPIRACFVGRIDPNKGPLEAVRAVRRAQTMGYEVELLVAGPELAWGHTTEELDQYVETLRDEVRLAGGRLRGRVTRQELPELYQHQDVAFVLSLSDEPFGLVALEAMASGCAVIASNRGGLPDTCGNAALLVDPVDEGSVDEALSHLLRDRSALRSWQRRARAHAERSTWARTATAILRLVEGAT